MTNEQLEKLYWDEVVPLINNAMKALKPGIKPEWYLDTVQEISIVACKTILLIQKSLPARS